MPFYTITSLMTDKDSPLNQTLFDYIRENLDYLKAQTDAMSGGVMLGSIGGDVLSGTSPNYTLAGKVLVAGIGNAVNLAGFNLAAPASGYKWAIEFAFDALRVGAAYVGWAIFDHAENELQEDHAYQPGTAKGTCTPARILYLTAATRGRISVWCNGGTSIWLFAGVVRAYQVPNA